MVDIGATVKSMGSKFDTNEAKGWSKTIVITVNGQGGGSWHFLIKDGKCEVKDGDLPTAEIKVSVDVATWTNMVDGKISGERAFMSGKLKVKGPMKDLIKTGQVFPGMF